MTPQEVDAATLRGVGERMQQRGEDGLGALTFQMATWCEECQELPADVVSDALSTASALSADDAVGDQAPIHSWFELTYAQYLTIPRSVLQSMPVEWQRRFVTCLQQLDASMDWRPGDGQQYRVTLHQPTETWTEDGCEHDWGPQLPDLFQDYERGRRRIRLKEPKTDAGK
jgi:hypothetical protein